MENLSTIIICAVIAAICIYAVFSYRKKLKNGCCGAGGGDVKVKPADKDKSNYPYKITVYIDGMTCNHCKERVENIFNAKKDCLAEVNLHKGLVQIWSKDPLPETEIRSALEYSDYTFVKCVKE